MGGKNGGGVGIKTSKQKTELDPSRSGHETFPVALGGYFRHIDTKYRYLWRSFVGMKHVPKGGDDAASETQDRTCMVLHWSELLCPYWPCICYAQTQNTRALSALRLLSTLRNINTYQPSRGESTCIYTYINHCYIRIGSFAVQPN